MSLPLHDGYQDAGYIQVSHFGYHPEHSKYVVYNGPQVPTQFEVVRAVDNTVAFSGSLTPLQDDFGPLLKGDFSAFSEEGEFYIRAESERSFGTFRIKNHLWDDYQKFIAVYFFGVRRVGEDNILGNMGDFHGVRWDDAMLSGGEGWRYIGRAFCDGNDRRVYPSVSLVVAQYCALKRTRPFWDSGDWIYAQVSWGLEGILSFLDKDGILRKALYAFPDNDTDGEFYSGDEKRLGDAFDQAVTCNEYCTANREIVYASLLLGPAEAVYTYGDRDPAFFDRVKKLCEVGYSRIERLFRPRHEDGFTLDGDDSNPFAGKYSSAAWIWLSALMHQITGKEEYMRNAVTYADILIGLQQKEPLGDADLTLSGWYRKHSADAANPWGEKPEQEVMITPWIYQCLFRLLEFYPDHARAEAWRESIRCYARDYLLESTKLNAFGFTPMKVGTSGLKRSRGTLAHQYFASVGRMFHQIGNAAYLIDAGKLLKDRELLDAGWTQIQWFAGFNPFGIGCIYGLSKNTPSAQYDSETFGRCVLGGTVNGMTGNADDRPEVRFWEYYTYANLNCLWFATAIGADRFSKELEIWPRQIEEAPHEPTNPRHRLFTFPVRLKGGFSYRFTAMQNTPAAVVWSVNGIEGGSKEAGVIDADGTYTAPDVSALMSARIRVAWADGSGMADETEATIMPVPAQICDIQCERRAGYVLISWAPLDRNCSGYTIWRRLPATDDEVGTIFERVGAVNADVSRYEYQLNAPQGIEFQVRGYHRSHEMIYGYGPPSDVVRLGYSKIARRASCLVVNTKVGGKHSALIVLKNDSA